MMQFIIRLSLGRNSVNDPPLKGLNQSLIHFCNMNVCTTLVTLD